MGLINPTEGEIVWRNQCEESSAQIALARADMLFTATECVWPVVALWLRTDAHRTLRSASLSRRIEGTFLSCMDLSVRGIIVFTAYPPIPAGVICTWKGEGGQSLGDIPTGGLG